MSPLAFLVNVLLEINLISRSANFNVLLSTNPDLVNISVNNNLEIAQTSPIGLKEE